MFDPKLFSNRRFTAGVSSGALAYVTLFGILFATPFFLESAQTLSPGQTGALLSALPLSLAVCAPFAGSRSTKVGSRAFTVTGMVTTALAMLLLALLHRSWQEVGLWLALAGIGLGMFMPSNTAALMTLAPRRQAALLGGILNMTRGVGTSFGLAATTLVFATVAGNRAKPILVDRAFEAAALFLAVVATSSAVLAALRPSISGGHSSATTAGNRG